jgi:FkbM family methyltransferase
MTVMYQGCAEERERVADSTTQLISLATRFTDDFSRLSINAYIDSFLNYSIEPLLPIMVPHSFEMFNRYSRHFSFVPSEDEIFVDVGAYDGDSILKFIESTPSGVYRNIHAFEPNALPRAALNEKALWLPNMTVHSCALSDAPGQTTFVNSGMGSRILSDSDFDKDAPSKINVEVKRLDDVISEATIIKVDTEGHEVSVINGAKRLISSSKPDLIVDTYHYPLDILKIYDSVMSIHSYRYVGWRLCHQDLHSLFFSDSQQLI